jgi:hypothetical protein
MGVHTPIPEKSLADSFYFSGALDEVIGGLVWCLV